VLNEAHDGLKRCVRTRRGAQPDMGELIQAALERGWTLWRYEADFDQARPPWPSRAL
jgi:hypothetical protein